MLEHTFVHTAVKLKYALDSYGQKVLQSSVTTKCRLREDATITEDAQMQQVTCSAIAHLPANFDISENDVLLIESNYYNVIKVVYARRLGSTAVLFKKAFLQRNTELVS